MNNLKSLLLAFTLLFAMPFAFTSCDKDKGEGETNNSFVGRWVEDVDVAPFYLTINSNNTGVIEYTIDDSVLSRATLKMRQEFNWKYVDTDVVQILTISGDTIMNDGRYQCIIIGNVMNFGNQRFTRIN